MTDWPQLVIFDCDGVLVDSEILALDCLRQALARLGVVIDFDRARDLFLGVSQQTMRKRTLERLGLDLPEGFEAAVSKATMEAFDSGLVGIPGLREALASLGAPVCVASSSPPERIAHSLRIAGYDDLFDGRVFSANEAKRGKPAPDLFLLAAERLGAPPRACLVIEDAPPGIDAALSAGMTAFGFAGASHSQGEGYRERLRAAGAVRIFDDMRALPGLIASERAARRGT